MPAQPPAIPTALPPAVRRSIRWLAAPAIAIAMVAFALPSFAADPDTQAPTAPGTPVVATTTTSSATLTWPPSTDNVGVTGYDVTYVVGNSDVFNRVITTTNTITVTASPSFTVRGSVTALDAAGNRSPATQFTITLPPGDTQPPTTPGTPVASDITANSVRLTWARSTDNVHGIFGIQVYLIVSVTGATETVVATVPQAPVFPTSWTVTGLTPGTTYQFAVRARDYAGNTSARSGIVTVAIIVNPVPPPLCSATYRIGAQWPGGFQGEVIITNTTLSPSTRWTVTWSFANGQTITNNWASIRTQTGASVTLRNETWNGNLAPGASTTAGFNATWSGTNSVPSPINCTTQ